jgi:hypothetical protein
MKNKIVDIFKPHINKVQLEVVFTNNEEQNEIVTILEYFKYHFETRTPLRDFHFQDGSKVNSYSFWGGKKVAIGWFDENANWYSKPLVMRYEDYHLLYEQIMKESEEC